MTNEDITYKIINKFENSNGDYDYNYNKLIKNFNFHKNKMYFRINYNSLVVSRAPRQIYVENMKPVLFSIHKNITSGYNYMTNFEKFFTNEINKPCQFTSGSQFSIPGKLTINQIEKLVDKYIDRYIRCPTCYSNSTFLLKENRIVKISCNLCNSTNAVINS